MGWGEGFLYGEAFRLKEGALAGGDEGLWASDMIIVCGVSVEVVDKLYYMC